MGNNITRSIKKAENTQKWYLIDATNIRLGKLAEKVTKLLMGKDKVNSVNYLVNEDRVLIINASKVAYHQAKVKNKSYYRHSGYPGGLTEEKFDKVIEKKPEYAIREAVWGMLPKNKAGDEIFSHLHIVRGEKHKFSAQNPQKIEL